MPTTTGGVRSAVESEVGYGRVSYNLVARLGRPVLGEYNV